LYEVKYNEKTDDYTFYNKGETEHTSPVKVMTSDEYRRYQFDNATREAWSARRTTEMGNASRSGGGSDASNLFSAGLKLNSQLSTNLFGNDFIKFNIQGSAEVIFGYNWSRTDNPTIPEQYRSHGAFDFKADMKINASGSIGDKINIDFINSTDKTFNFQTFSFQDLLKINYQGDEDDIVQKIEAGNVSLPLSGSLIQGSQSLFGFKTELKFGHLTVEAVLSEQKGQSSTINVKGGAQTTLFEIPVDKYDANRHFFLSHYFRNQFSKALKYLPLIQSGVTITRLEVWVTNRNNRFESARNIIALDTLGSGNTPTGNEQNNLYRALKTDEAVRDMAQANNVLNALNLTQGKDYEKIENARRLTAETDYTFNAQLGFISLTNALNADEVLAVAFEYTQRGTTYRVGEFYDDGVVAPKALIVKMLKGTNLSPRFNTWKLMMKNIYSLDAYQLSGEDFLLNVMYHDDQVGSNVPYLTEGNKKNLPLIQVLNVDNINHAGNRYPDGKFDYIEGVTAMSTNGRIMFPMLEPFGRDLGTQIGYPAANKYIYNELYDSTLVKARQFADKNKFTLTGSYKSSSSSEIILGATDIPEGAVLVTAGGIKLVENVDYTVNYTLGRVQIINPAYLNSNVPLQVSLESVDMFAFVKKTMIGTNLKYKFSKNFDMGATILRLSEKPMTQKVAYGDEPISNTIWGLNGSYTSEVNLLTKMVDALPFISTKEASNFSIQGEFAQLLPGHNRAIGSAGATYIDDFEATKMTIDLRQHTAWSLGSTPEFVTGTPNQFGGGKNTTSANAPLSNGYYRSKLAWYYIDPLFLRNTSSTPSYIRDEVRFRKNHYVREISEKEIFPNKDLVIGVDANIAVLNLAYYPNERGTYNYIDFRDDASFPRKGLNGDGSLKTPATNYGAMMRSLPITDFETSNVEYIEFWMMDPFIYTRNSGNAGKFRNGRLYFNLGDVSEDVMKDSRKAFENGLPYPHDTALLEKTDWGYVPKTQSLVNTFDNNEAARAVQDVGYDGMGQLQEQDFFTSYLSKVGAVLNNDIFTRVFEEDPSNDNYHYYRGTDYDGDRLDILARYKKYNNPEGNSPIATGGLSSSATTMPNTEDINKDNTLNELESYYEYFIELTPDAINENAVGQNYITDIRTYTMPSEEAGDYGEYQTINWYQFKIPIANGRPHGNVEDFKSMRFMRTFLTGFDTSVVCRFARMELVRAEWRKYAYSLLEAQEGLAQPETSAGEIDISAVSIEENSDRRPVNYVLPPGVSRVVDNTTNQQVQRNEQAMMLTVLNLADGDGRASYKNTMLDMREFRRLQMDVHAEAVNESRLKDNDLSLFVRIGSDYRYNYYEYEIPLRLTPWGRYEDSQRELVWPEDNKLDIALSLFTDLKLERNARMRSNSGVTLSSVYEKQDGKNTVRVVGNPNLGEVRVMMIGVKNPAQRRGTLGGDNLPKDGIVWINELRLTNFNEEGGWAANARVATNFADFANVSLAGSYSKAGFGSLDSRMLTRAKEDAYQYDLNTRFELGKFFPTKWGVTIPFGFAYAESFIIPLYNPFDPDIKLQDALDKAGSKKARDSISDATITYAMRKNINLSNVRINGNGEKRFGPIDVSNFTVGYMFNSTMAHDVNTERDSVAEHRFSGAYAYSFKSLSIEPFAKSKAMKGENWKIIRDFNFAPLPNQYGFATEYSDTYNEYIARSFYPGVKITPIIYRERTHSRNYTLGWDITKSLKFNFTAQHFQRQDVKTEQETGFEVDSAATPLNDRWRNTRYGHSFGLTYTLPINKIPVLSWVNVNSSYTGTYDWEAPQVLGDEEMPDVGNTIRNSNSFQINGSFNLVTLYAKSKFLKDIDQEFSGRGKKKREMKDVKYEQTEVNLEKNRKLLIKHDLKATGVKVQVLNEAGKVVRVKMENVNERSLYVTSDEALKNAKVVVTGKVPVPQNPAVYAGKLALRLLMLTRNFNVAYTRNGETMLPGYKPQTTLMGLDKRHNFGAPGWDFVAGSQSGDFWKNFFGTPTEYILSRARGESTPYHISNERNWLISGTPVEGDSTEDVFVNPFMMNTASNLSYRASFEPFRDLRIDLNATQTYSSGRMWYDFNNGNGAIPTPTETGSYTMSAIAIFSAFERPSTENMYRSETYDRFSRIRLDVAKQVAQRDSRYTGGLDSMGVFPDGFSGLAQDVLIPSFEAAYLNKGVNAKTVDYTKFLSRIPLPNWNVTYAGLGRIEALKGVVKSATLSHSYRCTYSISSFTSNSNFQENSTTGRDAQGDFYSMYSIANVSINESIVLGGLDITWANSLQTRFEMRRNRRVDLSLANNQIIENSAWEGVAGVGYTFANAPQIFLFSDKQSPTTSVTLRADFSYRDDMNLIRKLNENTHQITDGRRNLSLKFNTDYTLMKDLTLRVYFDWLQNNPYVSAVNTANVAFGFSLRYVLGM
jgi:cell surface protein SprA